MLCRRRTPGFANSPLLCRRLARCRPTTVSLSGLGTRSVPGGFPRAGRVGLWGRWVLGQSCAQDVGVGVVQVVEDGQSPLPGLVCGGDVARVLVGVAQADEGVGLWMASAQLLVQLQCVVVAGDGPPVLAEVVVGDAEAVPGVGLAVPAADRSV